MIASRKPNEDELDLAFVAADQDGIRLFIAIGGYAGNSTRTEIAAGILAIIAWGSVHIGSDSEVFDNKAKEILKDIQRGKLSK